MNLGEILCYFSEKCKLELSMKQVASIAFSGDITTITHIHRHCSYYCNLIGAYNPIFIGILHSGNLDLVKWYLANYHTRSPPLFGCLLRCNHLDKARSLLMSDPKLDTTTIDYIFYCPYDFYFEAMPKINLETYEFCLQLLGDREPIPKWWKNRVSDDVLQKYFKRNN